jgi:hypothetical protein
MVKPEMVAPGGMGKMYVPSAAQLFGLWKIWSIEVVAIWSATSTATRCDLTSSMSATRTGSGQSGSQPGGSTMITPSALAIDGNITCEIRSASRTKMGMRRMAVSSFDRAR